MEGGHIYITADWAGHSTEDWGLEQTMVENVS